MSTITGARAAAAAPTLPRFLAINKDFTDLDEQISQASRIVGLPEHWDAQEESDLLAALRTIKRARAEWVLRWTLDKLKDETNAGAQARRSTRAWTLLGCMLLVTPVSRSATHMRDADFMSILEHSLQEIFDKDETLSSGVDISNATPGEQSKSGAADEGFRSSRKRKRSSPVAATPLKRTALPASTQEPLFSAIRTVVKTVLEKITAATHTEEVAQAEHMRMVLRTDSAQAARVLEHWLTAVQRLSTAKSASHHALDSSFMDLSSVQEIWALRVAGQDDEMGASAEQFSAECLLPTILLHNHLRSHHHTTESSENMQSHYTSTCQTLETFLARHVFAPARAAFFRENTSSSSIDSNSPTNATQLASNLESLRAKILQAAQIQDATGAIPESYLPLFASIPELLDIAIRLNPSRTPKGKASERPWIQAVFVALADCAGCTREQPQYPDPIESIDAIKNLLLVLSRHDQAVDSAVLADLFWFHSGVAPVRVDRNVHWSLIAGIVNLDADIFLSRSSSTNNPSEERPTDLAQVLLDQISAITSDELDSPGPEDKGHISRNSNLRSMIVGHIVVPLIAAFARNRDLLGFIHRWDIQLSTFHTNAHQIAGTDQSNIWEDARVAQAVQSLFEKSLTQSQIVDLIREYAKRVEPNFDVEKSAKDQMNTFYSSTVLLRIVLAGLETDDIVNTLLPILKTLWNSYSASVSKKGHHAPTDVSSCWAMLCCLLSHLWPKHFHASAEVQETLLLPVLERATKTASKEHEKSRAAARSRCAALSFALSACTRLQTISSWEEVLREHARKALKLLASGSFDPEEQYALLQLFCTEYPQVLNLINLTEQGKYLSRLLSLIYALEKVSATRLLQSLSAHIFTDASTATREAYTENVMSSLASDNAKNRSCAMAVLVQVNPSALSRKQREEMLDKLCDTTAALVEDNQASLSAMVALQQVPNATAKISLYAEAMFEIAARIDASGSESPDTMHVIKLFQEFVDLTLKHILANKTQAQNEKYIAKMRKLLKKLFSDAENCVPSTLAIAQAAFLAQGEDDVFFDTTAYATMLERCADHDGKLGPIIESLNEIPSQFLEAHEKFYKRLRKLSAKHNSLEQLEIVLESLNNVEKINRQALELANYGTRTLLCVAKYRLCEDVTAVVRVAAAVLQELMRLQMPKHFHNSILRAARLAFQPLAAGEKLAFLPELVTRGEAKHSDAYHQMLPIWVNELDDELKGIEGQKRAQMSLLPTLCDLLTECRTTISFKAILDSIDTILRNKPSYTNQHSIECTITALTHLVSRSSPHLPCSDASSLYGRLCETSRLLLVVQRSRIGGRFHLLLPLLQNLLLCLFITNPGRGNAHPHWLRQSSKSEPVALTPSNAAQFARLLSTLCSPTQSSVSRAHQHRSRSATTQSTLNDSVKAAREYASHYIYALLAAFCRFQLNGRLEPQVRDKLMPGIWEVIEVANLDRGALDAMFAGLDTSTKDIWRGVFEEWRRLSGRDKAV